MLRRLRERFAPKGAISTLPGHRWKIIGFGPFPMGIRYRLAGYKFSVEYTIYLGRKRLDEGRTRFSEEPTREDVERVLDKILEKWIREHGHSEVEASLESSP
ncbi:MAG: hypothetical protein GTN93_26485 [Anaerolineae bacterium]|nr:hypothetical protein [Anaerolineae bacterium]